MPRYRHYELITPLGEGKTGQTWQALDTGHQHPVVLKFVAGDLSVVARDYLADLADIAFQQPLSFANILGVEDNDDGVVIVREYVEGESVKALSQRRMLSFEEFITLALSIAGALKTLHDIGVLHGNLTAENIIVNQSGTVWLTDAGLWPTNAVTNLRLALDRDIAYAAPEMVDSHSATVQTDLYMLGVVFYELLTGRLPFTLDDREYLLAAIRHDDPNFENDATLRMAGEGRLIIQKLMAKSPVDRIGSAAELVATLNEVRDFRKRESPFESEKGSRWTAKQYAFIAGVVALLVLYWVIYGQLVK